MSNDKQKDVKHGEKEHDKSEETEKKVVEVTRGDNESFDDYFTRFKKANPGISDHSMRPTAPMTPDEYRIRMQILVGQGLIAMAAILGIVGFMVLRRRKVTA